MKKKVFKEMYLYTLGYRDNVSIGKCFHYGTHVDIDRAYARQHYILAANKNVASAFYQLSLMANEDGHSDESIYLLGRMHECNQDWKKAHDEYMSIAEKNVASLYRLGCLYLAERKKNQVTLIKTDMTKALAFFRKAARQYFAPAIEMLIKITETNSEAAFQVAEMYELGEIGKTAKILTAVSYYEKASLMNHQLAAYHLGKLYEIGKENELNINLEKAFNFYAIAAKQRDNTALLALTRVADKLNLDEFRLELAIIQRDYFQNKRQALLLFIALSDKGNTKAITNLNSLVAENPNFAYEAGQFYEVSKKNVEKAFHFYTIATKKQHKDSLTAVKRISEQSDNDQLKLELATIYNDNFNDKQSTIILLKNLADKDNATAVSRLDNLAAHNAEMAYQIGAIYEAENINLTRAFNYYEIAAKKRHMMALEKVKKLVEISNDDSMRLKLAEIYQGVFKDYTLALIQYKYLADRDNKAATIKIDTITKTNAQSAYEFGKLYDDEDKHEKAYLYYIKAAINNHVNSFKRLESLASQGNSNLQYLFGYEYFYHINKIDQAIYWLILAADKNHSKAIDFLQKTNFSAEQHLRMAYAYENGIEIKKNIQLAVVHYEKACSLKNKDAAYYLGQLYEFNGNHEKACHYFLLAANYQHHDAIIPLDRLGQDVSSAMQLKLGDLYLIAPYYNLIKAKYWYEQAYENGSAEAQHKISMIDRKQATFTNLHLALIVKP